MHNVTAVIPAFNEAARIGTVLEAIRAASLVCEIIVVDDGSTDETAAIAQAMGIRVIRLPQNQGKGTAMRAGAVAATGDILLFLDADLIGITPTKLDALIAPVYRNRAEMAIGIFRGGRASTDFAQYVSPNISGQRCLYRDFFLNAPLIDGSRSGVEIALTIHARASKLAIEFVTIEGVTHIMKEEKLGFWRGTLARYRMYADILITAGRYYLLSPEVRHAPLHSE